MLFLFDLLAIKVHRGIIIAQSIVFFYRAATVHSPTAVKNVSES